MKHGMMKKTESKRNWLVEFESLVGDNSDNFWDRVTAAFPEEEPARELYKNLCGQPSYRNVELYKRID